MWAIFHHISLLRLLPKSHFKIITFQPNFLCSSYFNENVRVVTIAAFSPDSIVLSNETAYVSGYGNTQIVTTFLANKQFPNCQHALDHLYQYIFIFNPMN